MPLFKAATTGTLVVTAATALMAIVSVSTPIWKSIYFLEANFSGGASGSTDAVQGNVKLGTWGYCNGNECFGPTYGYTLDSDQLLNVASEFISLPNSLIRWLTYVLILHPIGSCIEQVLQLCV